MAAAQFITIPCYKVMLFMRATIHMKWAWAFGNESSSLVAGCRTHQTQNKARPRSVSIILAIRKVLGLHWILVRISMDTDLTKSASPSAAVAHRKTWSAEEDSLLIEYIKAHGEGQWTSLPLKAGLKRRGKSCRLRWFNYLHPNIKRGNFSEDEEELIIRLHRLLGNRWSLIAKRLPGRTDNDVKNYWNTHLCKKLKDNVTTSTPTPHSPLENTGTKDCYWNSVTDKMEKAKGVTGPNGENIEKVEICEKQTSSGFCEAEKIITRIEEEESYHQLQYMDSNEELLPLSCHLPGGQFSQHDILTVGADPEMNNLFYPDSLSLMLSDDFRNYWENL